MLNNLLREKYIFCQKKLTILCALNEAISCSVTREGHGHGSKVNSHLKMLLSVIGYLLP